jgi:hypothetical protein
MDGEHLDLEIFGLDEDFGARDGEFAEPAVPKAAAHHDALCFIPGLGFEEAARYVSTTPQRMFVPPMSTAKT